MKLENVGDAVFVTAAAVVGVGNGAFGNTEAAIAWIATLLWFGLYVQQRTEAAKWRKRAMSALYFGDTAELSIPTPLASRDGDVTYFL